MSEQTTKSLGKVMIVPKGEWNKDNTYNRLDIVTYNGSTYIALKNGFSNKAPVIESLNKINETYWALIAERGKDGKEGTGLTQEEAEEHLSEVAESWLLRNVQTSVNSAVFFDNYDASSKTYRKDDYIVHSGKLYKCIVAVVNSTEEWNSDQWEEIPITSYVDSTLKLSGTPADSKTVGDKINAIYSILAKTSSETDETDELAVIKKIYPTGSIYITTSTAVPGIDFWIGTQWQKIEGRFLLGAGSPSSTVSSFKLGDKNGEVAVSLAAKNIPKHKHDVILETPITTSGVKYDYPIVWKQGSLSGSSHVVSIDKKPTSSSTYGKSYLITDEQYSSDPEPIKIMPPYLVVNIWQRVDSDSDPAE